MSKDEKDQKGFIVYSSIQEVLSELDDAQVAQLFRGMVDYFVNGKDPKFSGILKFVFIPIRQQMDRDAEKYERKCEKMRENANKRWKNANASNGNQLDANDANTNTNTDTDTDTNTKTDTDTTTTTNTKASGGGSYKCDDEFNIWKRLTPDDIDVLYEKFPNSGGLLIDEVYEEVKTKKVKVKSGLNYILGYAKNVGWDDNADHFKPAWEA